MKKFQVSAEPSVTHGTFGKLEGMKTVNNPKLRHDINFDPELHFRPNLDGEKGRRKTEKAKCFWDTMKGQLQDYLNDRERFEMQLGGADWCLSATLNEIRGILKPLIPQQNCATFEGMFNVDLLVQQFQTGGADTAELILCLYQLIKRTCAPMRDDWVDRTFIQLIDGYDQKDVELLIGGIRNLLGVSEAMKLDVANHQIRCLRPILFEDAVHFEQKFFMKKLALRRVDIEGAQAWFRWTSSIPDNPPPDESSQAQKNNQDFMKTLADLTRRARSSETISHTFMFDEDRLSRLRSDMLEMVNLEICMQLCQNLNDPDPPVSGRLQSARPTAKTAPGFDTFSSRVRDLNTRKPLSCKADSIQLALDHRSGRVDGRRNATEYDTASPQISQASATSQRINRWLSDFLRKSALFGMVSLFISLIRPVSASDTTDTSPKSTGGAAHNPASFQSYFEELFSTFITTQAGPILTHFLWALSLSVCYFFIKRAHKTVERPASIAAFMLISEVASVFGGYKYHTNHDTPAGYESEMTDASLVIFMLFNGALTTLYSKSTLDKFRLGRIHTGLIIIAGAISAYVSAAFALWILDDVKGRYANKTVLFLTLLMPWISFTAFMYLSALADTPLGRSLDEGRYTEGLTGFVRSSFRGGDARGRNTQRGQRRGRGRGQQNQNMSV
ncbi:hypothetical protein VTL71DRAFT_12522 [Oculimacula yallundae]|uniref:Uncharacterized protein n=1 Tax=Oculimacula yallundae TaxID=86028 RepID=A0ABR4CMT3_9HELO